MTRMDRLCDDDWTALADEALARCAIVTRYSEEPGKITRTFLCEPMRRLHEQVTAWMSDAGMSVRRDAIGNLIGHYAAGSETAPIFLIGSHLDSVPNAGKYDGVLGVLLGIAAVGALGGQRLPFAIEVVGFSEEEGVRYRTPYLGSMALAGRFDPALLRRTDASGISLAAAIEQFGLDPAQIPAAAYRAEQVLGYFEVHIEQGPVLERLNLPIGVVQAIAGQSRVWAGFHGKAGHAGTMPMEDRQDALTAAAEMVLEVERCARSTAGLRGTVGTLSVTPGAVNVVPGSAQFSLDIRHAQDAVREEVVARLLGEAETIAAHRRLRFTVHHAEHQPAVRSDPQLTEILASSVREAGLPVQQMVSGAGHDAVIMASLAPVTMLFLRSPGGISHHPDETVLPGDVRIALKIMVNFLFRLAEPIM
jgi:allantoate deiminase